MEKEVMSFFHNAFCNRLRTIKSEMESHGGVFKDSQMIDDTNDCIRGIKNLQKIKAMEEKPATANASAMQLR
jgi:hypothetical protein